MELSEKYRDYKMTSSDGNMESKAIQKARSE